MPRAVVVHYSRTGHTRALSAEIQRRLSEAGVKVESCEVRPARGLGALRALRCLLGRSDEPARYAPLDLTGVNVLLIGTPLWGRGPSPYIRRFVREVEGLGAMPVVLFTTCSGDDRGGAVEFREIVRSRGGRPYGYACWHLDDDGPAGLNEAAARAVVDTLGLLPSMRNLGGAGRVRATASP
jgi:flavodoxin